VRDAGELAQLFAAGLVPCLAYLGVGQRLLRWLGLDAAGLERTALAWVFGTGVCSLAILLLRALAVPVPLLVAGVVVVLTWPLPWARRRGPGAATVAGPAAPTGWVVWVDRATGAVAGLTFAAALAPETYWDGFEYHLPLVAAWTEGPLRAVPGMLDAEFRAGVDLLYVPAVTSGVPDAAAAVSAGFALCLAALVRAEATRRASAGAGALAGLFVLLVPLVTTAAPGTYVDLGVAAYGFSALLLADRWNRRGARPALLGAACCLGFAANAKLHAACLTPAVLALVWFGGRRPPAALIARCAAVVVALALPWVVKVGLTTGNPFFPFFSDWLGTGPTDARNLEWRRHRIRANYPGPANALGLLQWLASLSFGRNPHVGGQLGPLPLALAPFALSRRLPRSSRALVAVVASLVVLQFFALPAARFGGALFAWLAVAAAVGGQRLAASGRAARGVLGGVFGLLLVHHGVATGVHYLPRLAALRDPLAYQQRVFPDQFNLRRMVSFGDPVVGIPMGAVSWMTQPVYNLSWERNGEIYFLAGARPEAVLERLVERGVRSLVLDVEPPHPDDGRTGHPVADAWLETGRATLARDVPVLPARGDKRWVLLRLGVPATPSGPAAASPPRPRR